MSRALISVSDKTGIVELAAALVRHKIEVVSTGGTSTMLQQAGIPVTSISDITGFPEIMDGRVKTLHPNIHGGLLAVRANPKHMEQMAAQNIQPIDYVIVNLYPFQETIEKPGTTLEQAIENIDIGGPSMLRAAAKNYQDVVVVVDQADYGRIIESLDGGEPLSRDEKLALAAKVFRHTAAYDALVSGYLSNHVGEKYPERLTVTYEKVQSLRYGENPHQTAAFYREPGARAHTIAGATQLHGKELSYNNINDANAALLLVQEFTVPAVVALKHANPCGVGVAATIDEAYQKAYEADPLSIFGGIVAFNRPVSAASARKMSELFLEIILAPDFSQEALEILTKKKNIRLMKVSMGAPDRVTAAGEPRMMVKVADGMLIQDVDVHPILRSDVRVVSKREPTEKEWEQMFFGWIVVKHVKSNAIVMVKDSRTVGVGAGQMNRLLPVQIALRHAGDAAVGAVIASDAFFPFADEEGLEAALKAGVTAVIQPGGAGHDQDVIDLVDRYGATMVFTGVRHFRH